MATVEWTGSAVRLIDQTKLPEEETHVLCRSSAMVAKAIRQMVVRGAPAIGAAAAFGAAMALREADPAAGLEALRASRPTARDLFWAIDRVVAAGEPVEEAKRIAQESIEACRRIGRFGSSLLKPGARVLTICNSGALAAVDYGTALGIVRYAHEHELSPSVLALETRPRAQGARLTTWELNRLGIPYRLLVDSAAGLAFRRGMVDIVIVGADRIAANGDVANKIGTYPLAILAREHGIPFHVAAPLSTVDLDTADGDSIPIEERAEGEVTTFAPPGTPAWNPAFDITPARLITSIVTEFMIVKAADVIQLRAAIAGR